MIKLVNDRKSCLFLYFFSFKREIQNQFSKRDLRNMKCTWERGDIFRTHCHIESNVFYLHIWFFSDDKQNIILFKGIRSEFQWTNIVSLCAATCESEKLDSQT